MSVFIVHAVNLITLLSLQDYTKTNEVILNYYLLPHPKTCITKVYELLHAASLSSEVSSHQKPAESSCGFHTQKVEADGMS